MEGGGGEPYTAQNVVKALHTLHSEPKFYAKADRYVRRPCALVSILLTREPDGWSAFNRQKQPLASRCSCWSTR